MEIVVNPATGSLDALCRRNRADDDARVTDTVAGIIGDVAREGDAALVRYARDFDKVELTRIVVDKEQLQAMAKPVTQQVRSAISRAAENIRKFHEAQHMHQIKVETAPGVTCYQRQVPIDRVGLYVPGGRAPLFSTLLMLAVPAKIARCRQVVVCTPLSARLGISPEIAYTALVCGIDHLYGVGGAQAIAAMAYGTESVPAVDKIFGPGNRYVTKAKQLVSSQVAIDMLAGPSEVMVMADDSAVPAFVAADLLSQAEHGPDSQAMMVTTSLQLAREVMEQVQLQSATLSRRDSVEGSLQASRIIVLPSTDEMVDFANRYAPEHLIISMRQPWEVAADIRSAGSVFIGNYSPESAGDYASGTNHTLPTSGLAHAYSGVNLDSFMKKITYQEITPSGLQALADVIVPMAHAEGLEAHANAVKVRLAQR